MDVIINFTVSNILYIYVTNKKKQSEISGLNLVIDRYWSCITFAWSLWISFSCWWYSQTCLTQISHSIISILSNKDPSKDVDVNFLAGVQWSISSFPPIGLAGGHSRVLDLSSEENLIYFAVTSCYLQECQIISTCLIQFFTCAIHTQI